METVKMSATKARNNFFKLIDSAVTDGVTFVIDKIGTEKSVIITSSDKTPLRRQKRMSELKKTFGILKGVSNSEFTSKRFRIDKGKFLKKLRNAEISK